MKYFLLILFIIIGLAAIISGIRSERSPHFQLGDYYQQEGAWFGITQTYADGGEKVYTFQWTDAKNVSQQAIITKEEYDSVSSVMIKLTEQNHE